MEGTWGGNDRGLDGAVALGVKRARWVKKEVVKYRV